MRAPTTYLSKADVGGLFGLGAPAVGRWLERYPDFPAPDVVVGVRPKGRMQGWAPGRMTEILEWYAHRFPKRCEVPGKPLVYVNPTLTGRGNRCYESTCGLAVAHRHGGEWFNVAEEAQP